MNKTERTNSPNVPGFQPGHCLYEIPRGQAAPVLAAAGFVKQFDSGDPRTVLVEVSATSAAYNLINAL